MDMGIVYKLQGARRGFTYSVLLSASGLLFELLVFALWGSIILLTDILHWAVDTVLEVFALVAVYYALRVGRKFPWGVLVLEGAIMLLSIIVALGVYVFSFIGYIVTEYSAGSVTTTSLLPALGTVAGAVFTLVAFVVQKKNYEEYGLQVLKVDYTHALIDLVASFVSTAGIVAAYYTRSTNVEVMFVFVSMMFIIHSLVEILRDVVKTVTGSNIDHELSMKLYKKLLDELHDVVVNDVVARRIGSFYAVEAKIQVKPDTKISTVHRLRRKIVKKIHEESDLIYHVDVKVYPMPRRERRKMK